MFNNNNAILKKKIHVYNLQNTDSLIMASQAVTFIFNCLFLTLISFGACS